MRDYAIVAGATCDLPDEVVQELDLDIIPMEFNIDGTVYYHYPDEREMSSREFYQKLRDGKMPTTAQLTPFVFEETFRKHLEAGRDVLAIIFSSGLSGSYNSANVAAETLQDDIDTLAQWLLENRFHIGHWFTVEDLFHLNRGGRLSAVSAVVGTALKIKPVLSVDADGKLYVVAKARGAKKAFSYLLERIGQGGDQPSEQTVIVGHADNPEMAEQLKAELLSGNLAKKVIVANIGPIIGTHVGPGMLALVFLEKADRRQN